MQKAAGGGRLTPEMERGIRGALAREEFFGWEMRRWLGPVLQEIDALREEVEAGKAQLKETIDATSEAMEQVKRERDAARALAETMRQEASKRADRALALRQALNEAVRERDAARARAQTWKAMAKRLYSAPLEADFDWPSPKGGE